MNWLENIKKQLEERDKKVEEYLENLDDENILIIKNYEDTVIIKSMSKLERFIIKNYVDLIIDDIYLPFFVSEDNHDIF